MEKDFIYPQMFEGNEETTNDIAALRGKLYRTLLEQRTATEYVWLAPAQNQRSAEVVHA